LEALVGAAFLRRESSLNERGYFDPDADKTPDRFHALVLPAVLLFLGSAPNPKVKHRLVFAS
jgi:hypothetical protein